MKFLMPNSVDISETSISNKFCLLLFLILIKNITTTGHHFNDVNNLHHLSKRMMDLELCLGQFDVHHDTIIRTEESQAIGGKYLQGIGLNNLDECQRLCCETERCDVYIFEEKAEGYCYLFECGPPENFHCKFTRHANYTSAVLTPIRHATPPPPPTVRSPPVIVHPLPQIPPAVAAAAASLSQHELELTNLKQKPELNIQQGRIPTTMNPTLGAGVGGMGGIGGDTGIRMTEQITTPKNPQLNTSVCGRFQFQCHSGECIAVYNACDGIPQCEDGSDEGPECPATTGVEAKSINAETSKLSEITNYNRIPSGAAAAAGAVSLSKQSMQVLPRQYQQQQQPIQAPIVNNREDPMSGPPLWSNRKGQDIQPDVERNSHIFNHKGGLQLSTNNLGPQYQNPGPNIYSPMQRDMYMQGDIQDGYRSPIIQPQDHMIAPPNVNWQQTQIQQQSLIPPGPYVITVNGQPVPQVKAVPMPQQPTINNVQIKPDSIKNSESLPVPSETNIGDKVVQNQKDHVKEKGSAEESEEYSYYEEKSTEPPKKKARKHKKISSKENKNKSKKEKEEKEEKIVEASLHERYKMIKDDLEMEFVDHDGQSERPGGAVLSLTLGIIVTAALAILVGCRMRTVSRRVRRIGKTPYAHDADFLVNGMYL